MIRKYFLSFVLFTSFLLLFGCANPMSSADDNSSFGITYSSFKKRFDKLPDGITASPWKSNPHENDNTIYSTILLCNDNQYEHLIEITVNGNKKIADVTLQNSKAENEDSCFSEICFHVFCSMGFNDKDGKGNIMFRDANNFYATFDNFKHENTQNTVYVDNHEVKYVYQSDTETAYFTIHNMRSE